MDYVYNLVNNVKYFYFSMNPAVLSGAIDVIVVEQPDGTYRSTPFHVRFGRYGVFNFEDKYVDVQVNGVEIDLKMKLGENGVVFFVEANSDGERVPRHLATSPVPEDVIEQRQKAAIANAPSTSNADTEKMGCTIRRLVKRRHSFASTGDFLDVHRRRRLTPFDTRKMLRTCCSDSTLCRPKHALYHHDPTEWKWGEIPITKKSDRDKKPSKTEAEQTAGNKPDMIATDYKRSLRLSSDEIRLLNLNYGSNEARFSITTKFQGTTWCVCHIYLLKWSEQLVISDIDGTITKSDVLGHVIPAIGGTWAHAGVAELYTRIKANGYRMVYLSSRAIGMSGQTKNYLKAVKQGTRTLPDGPVLLSPTSVLMALRKEVIERKPEEFKIACLKDLMSLFHGRQPFFAGFGNRPTDVKSYRAVDIPYERIFIINPCGVVTRADGSRFSSDYAAMANGSVDFIFPPLLRQQEEQRREKQKPLIQPEDIFLTSTTYNAERGTFYDGLVDDESLSAYVKRSATARQHRGRNNRRSSGTKKSDS